MIGIVAANHERIRIITADLGLARTDVVAIPLRTVHTAARGSVLDTVLVDGRCADADLSDVEPALFASGGKMYVLTNMRDPANAGSER